VPIDALNGSSQVSINGGEPIGEMVAFLRNTDPASVAGIPGLSLPAGMKQEGLPVGIELDGPTGSDRRFACNRRGVRTGAGFAACADVVIRTLPGTTVPATSAVA